MECPNGCGDMEQLVSVNRERDKKAPKKMVKTIKLIYERCRTCGHTETVALETYQD